MEGGGEGTEGTVLCACGDICKRGGGGGWVGAGEGLGEEEEELGGLARGHCFVLPFFLFL